MNRLQKEVQQAFIDSEKSVLKELEASYRDALIEIDSKLSVLLARQDVDLEHVIYQVEHQKALRTQVQSILEGLQAKEFETLSGYFTRSYTDGFLGTMYDIKGQGIPLIIPIDQKQVLAAIQHETKLSSKLYTELGHDIGVLQKNIAGEISRGIASGMGYPQIARNIANYAKIPKNRAMTIARTESHRIQCKATSDAQFEAKKKGADVVKQWDAALDGDTRPNHRQLDGQIRELEERFEVGKFKPRFPGDFGVPGEDCNCRCALLQRARWALDESELETLKERAEYFGLDKTKDFEDYKKKYLKASEQEQVRSNAQKMNDDVVQRLKDKGVSVDIEGAGKYKEEALENLEHLDKLTQEYNNTTISYTLVKGSLQEGGSAYMMNGRTAISINPVQFKKNKATDTLKLGDNQPYGITYHEFAHTLSQSREKIDGEFWKEIRKIKREYEGKRGENNWFDVKISDYASKDIDEFLAEAFTQAKLSGNPSVYSQKVLDVVDKYFKKESLENIGKSGIIKVDKDMSKYIGKEIVETDNKSIREWYYANVHDIPNQIDRSKPFEEQVKQAYNLRNNYKHEARVAMSDRETAERLEKKRPVKSFDELLQDKMNRKGLSKEEALQDILETASKTNVNVDNEFGL